MKIWNKLKSSQIWYKFSNLFSLLVTKLANYINISRYLLKLPKYNVSDYKSAIIESQHKAEFLENHTKKLKNRI